MSSAVLIIVVPRLALHLLGRVILIRSFAHLLERHDGLLNLTVELLEGIEMLIGAVMHLVKCWDLLGHLAAVVSPV